MHRSAAAAVLLLALSARIAIAQSLEVTAVAGRATDTRGISSSALTLSPVLMLRPGRSARLALGAGGTRFDTGAWSLQGLAGFHGTTRLVPHLDAVLDAGGSAITTSYDTRWLTGGVTPRLAFSTGRLTLEAGGRLAAARISTVVATPGPLSRPGTVSSSRSGTGLLFGGAMDLLRTRDGTVAVRYDEEHMDIEQTSQVSRRAALAFSGRRVALSGFIGQLDTNGDHRLLAGGQFIMALNRALALVVSAEQYGNDPLTGNVAGSTISAGLRLAIGGGGSPRLPTPAGAPRPAPGYTRLSIRAPGAASVALAGDWNHWEPAPVLRASNGVWYADLRLAPGEYRYAFLIDGTEWRVPDRAPSSEDAFGTRSAWLTVTGGQDSTTTNTN